MLTANKNVISINPQYNDEPIIRQFKLWLNLVEDVADDNLTENVFHQMNVPYYFAISMKLDRIVTIIQLSFKSLLNKGKFFELVR